MLQFGKNLAVSAVVASLVATNFVAAEEPVANSQASSQTSVCKFVEPTERVYDVNLVTVRKKLKVEKGEKFEVKVYVKNASNVPLFSDESPCPGLKLFLGTEKERDRTSKFYQEGAEGWKSGSRVRMDQEKVLPGKMASFTFEAVAGEEDAVYKEYFAPVIEGVTWIEDELFDFDVIVGEPAEDAKDLREKMAYASYSGNVSEIVDLDADKRLLVDLSEQTMKIMLGEHEIKEIKISSGAADTPTPVGTHTIVGKQDVRIGGKSPHYIMPRFQMLSINGRAFTGYGIHALPSLGSSTLRAKIRGLQKQGLPVPHSLYENDTMWTEAWDHLGRKVSHGCMRVAPDAADFLFEFTEIGETTVVVSR
ncbi:L,D-transpeptidase [Candidatus Gracilibacteria bacterium]|nr:L,D-transpeptidase [Candidatus Gracilibacteria bacterium]